MPVTPPRARLGGALRAIRSHLRLTLAEVSARTGLAVSTLSKVENGQLSLTYDKLLMLSGGLQVDINALFDAEPVLPEAATRTPTGRRSIARAGSGLVVETPNYDYRYLCTDLARKAMVPILITIRARSTIQLGALSAHAGEEFIYVLKGKIEVHTEFYAPLTLGRGEGIYLDSTMQHGSLTVGRGTALILNICWSPNAGHFRTLVELAEALTDGMNGTRLRRSGEPDAGHESHPEPAASPPGRRS
jgi:transcriptional regulator with XRE-family HTH domain